MPIQSLVPLCRNMDIVGVPEISAEAELLSAIVAFLERVGLGPADVCIKVSSRKVLQVKNSQSSVVITGKRRI